MNKRVFLIVLDSAGVGEAPDADLFDDVGCDTFGSCVRSGNLNVPVMTSLGLYNLDGTSFEDKKEGMIGSYAKIQEKSMGKDTTVGHWEIAGVVSPKPMPTYPNGFPEELVKGLEDLSGRKVICNAVYSGTEVIKDYGKESVENGSLILYTSADSVFQIAAHEEVVPLEELYDICKKSRAMLTGDHAVGRVIARPFVGEYPNYQRTTNRHDFSLTPPRDTMLDAIGKAGKKVIGVGKIYDIFAGIGVQETTPNKGNDANMKRTFEIAKEDWEGLCFVNLVDFDMLYGHRNDIPGYTNALNAVDIQLGELMEMMDEDDILIVTADHGCDPGFKGTDHSREYIPCLVYGKHVKEGVNLGIRKSYADIAQTVCEYLDVPFSDGDGESFWKLIEK